MLLHHNPLFQIYFGNAKDQLFPKDYLNIPKSKDILAIEPFTKLTKLMQPKALMFLRQEHTDHGMILDEHNIDQLTPFEPVGDFLMTDQHKVAIGVMAGDCLPIIFFDNFSHVACVVHAGWRGSMKEVATKAVRLMQATYNTDLEHLRVFFGPSAKSCCYVVGEEFYEHINDAELAEKVLQKRGSDLFFDLPGFNKLQLEAIGLKKEAFRLDYNLCTICDEQFFSHRRDGKKSGRQMAVVCLR